jgi:hypothetical protein
MHPSVDPTANIRLRSERVKGGQKIFHIRLDSKCVDLLQAIKEAYDNPSDTLDVVSTPLTIKRALRFYAQYALRPESRAIEFKELRSGAGVPKQAHRHRRPTTVAAKHAKAVG